MRLYKASLMQGIKENFPEEVIFELILVIQNKIMVRIIISSSTSQRDLLGVLWVHLDGIYPFSDSWGDGWAVHGVAVLRGFNHTAAGSH